MDAVASVLFTAFAEPVKIVVMAFSLSSIVADIGSWWLAKFVASLAPVVILGGVCLALSFPGADLPLPV